MGSFFFSSNVRKIMRQKITRNIKDERREAKGDTCKVEWYVVQKDALCCVLSEKEGLKTRAQMMIGGKEGDLKH